MRVKDIVSNSGKFYKNIQWVWNIIIILDWYRKVFRLMKWFK
jgi:hypothetical protein